MTGSGDRVGWPRVPADLLPGPERYFEEHGPADMVMRIVRGVWTSELRHLTRSFGYGRYLVLYSALFGMLAWIRRKAFYDACIANGLWVRTGFALAVVFGYLLTFAFYSPIVRGPRLVLALYLPTMFCLFWFLSRGGVRDKAIVRVGGFDVGVRHFHLAALSMLAFDVLVRMPNIITTDFAGA